MRASDGDEDKPASYGSAREQTEDKASHQLKAVRSWNISCERGEKGCWLVRRKLSVLTQGERLELTGRVSMVELMPCSACREAPRVLLVASHKSCYNGAVGSRAHDHGQAGVCLKQPTVRDARIDQGLGR